MGLPARPHIDIEALAAGQAVQVAQPQSWYAHVLPCGWYEDVPVVTLTASPHAGSTPDTPRSPSHAYLRTIARGLHDAHGLSHQAVADYLVGCPGVAEHYDGPALVVIAREAVRRRTQ